MADEISVPQAARLLGCSDVTARKLANENDEIISRAEMRGSRTFLRVDLESVQTFVSKHGQFTSRDSSLNEIRREIAELRVQVSAGPDGQAAVADLRAQVVTLEDALRLQRDLASLQRDADDARSEMAELLTQAIAAGERADSLRRKQLATMDAIVGQLTTPGHPGGINPPVTR